MTLERQDEICNDATARLTPDELRGGWHFCEEFDYLLTTGEVMMADEITCICGFDPRKVDRLLAGSSRFMIKGPLSEAPWDQRRP